MEISHLITVIAGLTIGLVAGYALWRRGSAEQAGQREQLLQEQERLKGACLAADKQAELLRSELDKARSEREGFRRELEQERIKCAQLETAKESVEQQIKVQKEDIAHMQESFRKDFEILANRIFTEKSEKFQHQSRTSIDQLLEPLKIKIKEFEGKVESTHKESLVNTSSLKEEIKHLRETGQRMSVEAENLTKALKNDSKIQGNWGEYILESILERSGLVKDREYFTQQSFTTEEGRRLQPDVMVKLPDDKWVIIDSKVSLTAYERYTHEEDEKERQAALQAHIQSMRTHIRGLSGKNYQNKAMGKNLDFILLFVPIEGAYLTALNSDRQIFDEAYQNHIILVCPSTLIASLRIIASTWKHEYQNENALEIARRGKLLLEKFANFVEDMNKIGTHIEKTESSYRDAMKKLRDGRGSLIKQAQQLEDLGLKPSKSLEA